MPPFFFSENMKELLAKLNGWAKVIAIVFACGMLYAKVDTMDRNIEKVLVTHERYDTWLGNHESRISVLEALEAQELNKKGVK